MSWAHRKAATARRKAAAGHRQAIRDEHAGKEAKGSHRKTGGGGPQKPAKPK